MSRSNLAPCPPEDLGSKATLAAILGAGTIYVLGCGGPTCIAAAGLTAISVRIAFIDLKQRIISDWDIAAIILIGSAWVLWTASDPLINLINAVLHGLGYSAFFQAIRLAYMRLRGRDGLGFGDVKLAAAAGPLLSADAFGLAVATAAFWGLAFILVRAHVKGRSPSRYTFIPFGCSLVLSILMLWYLQNGILSYR